MAVESWCCCWACCSAAARAALASRSSRSCSRSLSLSHSLSCAFLPGGGPLGGAGLSLKPFGTVDDTRPAASVNKTDPSSTSLAVIARQYLGYAQAQQGKQVGQTCCLLAIVCNARTLAQPRVMAGQICRMETKCGQKHLTCELLFVLALPARNTLLFEGMELRKVRDGARQPFDERHFSGRVQLTATLEEGQRQNAPAERSTLNAQRPCASMARVP